MNARNVLVAAALLVATGSVVAQPASRRAARSDVVGRWTEDGDCRHWIDLRANGHFEGASTAPGEWGDDDHGGIWLQQESYGAAPPAWSARLLADGRLQVDTGGYNEPPSHWTRCPAAAPRSRVRRRRH